MYFFVLQACISTFKYYFCFLKTYFMDEPIAQAKTWGDLVAEIEANDKRDFPLKHKKTVRFYISNVLLKEFPDRMYKTWTDEKNELLTVFRVK